MKNYLNLIQELSLAQRIKRGKAIKRKMSIIKRKRALSMRRPPTPEKMERGVKKAVRMIGFAVKDKSGKYKDASPGEKERIEKRVGKWMKKFFNLSGSESLAAVGNIFLGQTESPLLVRPFIEVT